MTIMRLFSPGVQGDGHWGEALIDERSITHCMILVPFAATKPGRKTWPP